MPVIAASKKPIKAQNRAIAQSFSSDPNPYTCEIRLIVAIITDAPALIVEISKEQAIFRSKD